MAILATANHSTANILDCLLPSGVELGPDRLSSKAFAFTSCDFFPDMPLLFRAIDEADCPPTIQLTLSLSHCADSHRSTTISIDPY